MAYYRRRFRYWRKRNFSRYGRFHTYGRRFRSAARVIFMGDRKGGFFTFRNFKYKLKNLAMYAIIGFLVVIAFIFISRSAVGGRLVTAVRTRMSSLNNQS